MNAKFLVVSMMGLGLSAMGCMQDMSDDELAALDYNEYLHGMTPEDPAGGSTTNHVTPSIYNEHKDELVAAMNYGVATKTCSGLLCTYSNALSPNITNTGIMSTSGGRELFKVAVECALAEDKYVYTGAIIGITYYHGKGLMATTAGWYAGGLTLSQKEDVLRCVVARVNQAGITVPILLTGRNVTDKPSENHEYSDLVADAFWDVRITSAVVNGVTQTTINEYAWPLTSPRGNTSVPYAVCNDPVTAFEARVCDSSSASCGFTVRMNAVDECIYRPPSIVPGDKGAYLCDTMDNSQYRRVVQSWVHKDDVVLLNNDCTLATVPVSGTLYEMIPSY